MENTFKVLLEFALPMDVVKEAVLLALSAVLLIECALGPLGPLVHLVGAVYVGLLPCSVFLLAGSADRFLGCSCCCPLLRHPVCRPPLGL